MRGNGYRQLVCVRDFGRLLCTFMLLLGTVPASATDGYYDTTFGFGGKHLFLPSPTDSLANAHRLRILSDGTLLVGGTCYTNAGGTPHFSMCLAWVQPGGSDLNHIYGPAGSGNFATSLGDIQPGMGDMALLPDGRIALLGIDVSVGCVVVMVRSDGSAPDTTVGGGTGVLTVPGFIDCNRILVQGDGKFLVAGGAFVDASASEDMAVVRVLADLSGPDPQFNGGKIQTIGFDLGGQANDVANAMALQPGGRILIAGTAQTTVGFEPAFARLLADGRFDNAVNDPTDPFGPSVHDGRMHLAYGGFADLKTIALDRAGNIVYGGSLTDNLMVGRLLANGSGLDPAFNGGTADVFRIDIDANGDQKVNDVALQSDGRILATGYYPRISPATGWWFCVTRILANGDFDDTFGISGSGTGTFAEVAGTDSQSDIGMATAIGDGGIIIAGYGDVSGTLEFGVSRVQLDLIFDDTFD